jgi:hypothetical protein
MNSDVITRILVEVATGKSPAVPDDHEMKMMRAQLQLECDEIVAAGGVVDVPHEIPDIA